MGSSIEAFSKADCEGFVMRVLNHKYEQDLDIGVEIREVYPDSSTSHSVLDRAVAVAILLERDGKR